MTNYIGNKPTAVPLSVSDIPSLPTSKITSGTFGPSVDHPISMGYVENNYSSLGTKIFLEIRGKKVSANICKLPFYQKNYVKEI